MFLKFLIILSISLPVFASDLVAINIALRPSPSLEKVLKGYNDKTEKLPIGFSFDETHFPHLTIFQGVFKRSNLPQIRRAVEELKFKPMKLTPSAFELDELEGNSTYQTLSVAFNKNEEIQVLQNTIVSKLKAFLVKSRSPDAFFDPKAIQPQFVKYTNDYMEKKTGSSFEPHVTVGVVKKEYKPEALPAFEVDFDSIQIYQVGEFGSARKDLTK